MEKLPAIKYLCDLQDVYMAALEGKTIAINVNLEVNQISGFTGHSDRKELIEYAKRLGFDRPPGARDGLTHFADTGYIRYQDGSEELYDHRIDPNEWENLAGDPDFDAVVEAHHTRFSEETFRQ